MPYFCIFGGEIVLFVALSIKACYNIPVPFRYLPPIDLVLGPRNWPQGLL